MTWANELRDLREFHWKVRYHVGRARWAMRLLVLALSVLALWATVTQAKAQTRQCVSWGYQQYQSQEWPYRYYKRRYCVRHAYVDSYRRDYRQTDEESDRSWNRRDPNDERGVACLPVRVRVVGPARLNEKTALEAAIRAWGSAVAYDHAEKYMEIADARRYLWRCNRASSNESVVGKAGEAVFGDAAVQKKCVVVATPCLPPMKEGDKDER
jgi:hypothetical protein